jgi:lipoprotein signal peptidase
MSEVVGAPGVRPNAVSSELGARRAPLQFFAAAIFIVALDQLSKFWIRSSLPPGARREVLPGWVHLSHSLNDGAAWNMMSGQRWLLIFVSIVVSVFTTEIRSAFKRITRINFSINL